MPDLLKAFEKAAKAVRGGLLTAADVVTHGIVAAADNLAFLLDGLCRAPEYSAAAPLAADDPAGGDLAPTPEAGAASPAGSPTWLQDLEVNARLEAAAMLLRQVADSLDPYEK